MSLSELSEKQLDKAQGQAPAYGGGLNFDEGGHAASPWKQVCGQSAAGFVCLTGLMCYMQGALGLVCLSVAAA